MTKHALAKRAVAERQRRSVQRMVRPLLEAGQVLANMAFNMKQDGSIPEGWRKQLATWQAKWDAARPDAKRAIGL